VHFYGHSPNKSMKEIREGTVLFTEGEIIRERCLIMKGTVKASCTGIKYQLRGGDIVGLCEANRDVADMRYVALEDLTVIALPGSKNQLKELMAKNSETIRYFVSSLFRQLSEINGRCRSLQYESDSLWEYLQRSYSDYKQLCKEGDRLPETLAGYEELQRLGMEDYPPSFISGYYATLEQMLSIWDYNKTDLDFIYGFLIKASDDMHKMISYCKEAQAYKEELCRYFFSDSGPGLFDFYTELYLEKLGQGISLQEKMLMLKIKIREMVSTIQKQVETDDSYYKMRYEEFESNIIDVERQKSEKIMETNDIKELIATVAGSLDKILGYAECDEELETSFRKRIEQYKRIENKTSSDDDIRLLRRELTSAFYKVYAKVFRKTVEESDVPAPWIVHMFLNFGYVDEELAGINNAVYLYQLVQRMPTAPEKGTYSIYQWFKAIYEGKKEPGRNEFDLDYPAYLREQKRMGNLTAAQEADLLEDNMSKVMFELENVFPPVNKISYGRPSTFCPLFSKHNIIKQLNTMLVTHQKISETLTKIRTLDFGAFTRETLFSAPDKGIPKEEVQVEVMPDVILTPNVGSRGVMWQEIEGKKRTTPARLYCSIFQAEDITLIFMRLIAEFRWEMCKRIQGARWNDATERSLTSEYCDYAQFYRKNKDLSAEAKERIKVQQVKAKNNFKEMFIADYITWLRYESVGAPRLNKIVRSIMFTYCSFPKEITAKLMVNPLYKEVIERRNVQIGQKLHHVDNVCKKLMNMGKPIPEEIEIHRNYLQS